MIFKKLHNYYPFSKLLMPLLFLAIGLQFIVIFQMYFFRNDLFSSPLALLIRIFRGIILSYLAGTLLSYPLLFIIRKLNHKLPWQSHAGRRFLLQFFTSIVSGVLVTPLILVPAGIIFGMEYDWQTILNNAFYLIILSMFLMVILEARIYFEEGAVAKIKAENFEKEKQLNQNLEKEIEKREELTRQLNENREQLHSILSNLVGAAYRCHFDEFFTVDYISEKIFEITGYHATDFYGNKIRSFASIIHPDDYKTCRNNILRASQQNIPYEFEYRIIHRDGHTIWVNENGKCIFNEQGELVFLDGIIIDISRRKEAELAASESERKYKDLMDFLPQPVFELDLEGHIVLTNKAGHDFFGQLPDDPANMPSALNFFVEEDIPRIIENFKKSGQGIETEPGEFTAIKKDGSLCPVMIFGNPIIRKNKIVGRRGIIIDISERKKYETSLLKAKSELEEINSNLEQMVARRTNELTQANTQLLKVQKENLQSQFEVLKQQVNPHFLFNSLNVLTSLIKIDPDLAEAFTERLSKVYRYVLENKEKDVVSLSTELEFLNAYLFLLEIRFMKKLVVDIKIDKSYYDYQILPIAIQLLIENAIKHNTFSKARPLKIDVFVDDKNNLNIINNLNKRETQFASTGVGLENIIRRYALVSDKKPEFTQTNDLFVARLPLLKAE